MDDPALKAGKSESNKNENQLELKKPISGIFSSLKTINMDNCDTIEAVFINKI